MPSRVRRRVHEKNAVGPAPGPRLPAAAHNPQPARTPARSAGRTAENSALPPRDGRSGEQYNSSRTKDSTTYQLLLALTGPCTGWPQFAQKVRLCAFPTAAAKPALLVAPKAGALEPNVPCCGNATGAA
jgi:hypothetical protein